MFLITENILGLVNDIIKVSNFNNVPQIKMTVDIFSKYFLYSIHIYLHMCINLIDVSE